MLDDVDKSALYGTKSDQSLLVCSSARSPRCQVSDMAEFQIRGQVEVYEKIGSGSFGKVCVGEWQGAPVAVRVIECESLQLAPSKSSIFVQTLFAELDAVKYLSHANILQSYGICSRVQNRLTVLTELMHQSLRQRLLHGPAFNRMARLFVLRSVACGLRYLHELPSPVVHRCLASSCVFLSRDSPKVKIGDVGMAAVRDFHVGSTGLTRLTTAHYMSPEQVSGDKPHTSFDMFAYGVLAMETVSGRLPLPGAQIRPGTVYFGSYVVVPETVRRQENLRLVPLEHDLYPIIVRCLKDASKRPTAAEVVNTFRLIGESHAQLARTIAKDLQPVTERSEILEDDEQDRLSLPEAACQFGELQRRREYQKKEGEAALLKASVRQAVKDLSYRSHVSKASGPIASLRSQVICQLFMAN